MSKSLKINKSFPRNMDVVKKYEVYGRVFILSGFGFVVFK